MICPHDVDTAKKLCWPCRQAEKAASRARDAEDIATGRATPSEVNRRNAFFSPEFVARCRVNYRDAEAVTEKQAERLIKMAEKEAENDPRPVPELHLVENYLGMDGVELRWLDRQLGDQLQGWYKSKTQARKAHAAMEPLKDGTKIRLVLP